MISLSIPQSFKACVNFTQEVGGVWGSRYKTPWYKGRKTPYEPQKTGKPVSHVYCLYLPVSSSSETQFIYQIFIIVSFLEASSIAFINDHYHQLIFIEHPLDTYYSRAGRLLYNKCLTVNYTLFTFIVFS